MRTEAEIREAIINLFVPNNPQIYIAVGLQLVFNNRVPPVDVDKVAADITHNAKSICEEVLQDPQSRVSFGHFYDLDAAETLCEVFINTPQRLQLLGVTRTISGEPYGEESSVEANQDTPPRLMRLAERVQALLNELPL